MILFIDRDLDFQSGSIELKPFEIISRNNNKQD